MSLGKKLGSHVEIFVGMVPEAPDKVSIQVVVDARPFATISVTSLTARDLAKDLLHFAEVLEVTETAGPKLAVLS